MHFSHTLAHIVLLVFEVIAELLVVLAQPVLALEADLVAAEFLAHLTEHVEKHLAEALAAKLLINDHVLDATACARASNELLLVDERHRGNHFVDARLLDDACVVGAVAALHVVEATLVVDFADVADLGELSEQIEVAALVVVASQRSQRQVVAQVEVALAVAALDILQLALVVLEQEVRRIEFGQQARLEEVLIVCARHRLQAQLIDLLDKDVVVGQVLHFLLDVIYSYFGRHFAFPEILFYSICLILSKANCLKCKPKLNI